MKYQVCVFVVSRILLFFVDYFVSDPTSASAPLKNGNLPFCKDRKKLKGKKEEIFSFLTLFI